MSMCNCKVFISYYHDDDQFYKNSLIGTNYLYDIFVDNSVNTGDIDDENMTDEEIRVKIRDEYIKDADVFILLCGRNTKHRKHVDWEIHAAMYKNNDKKPIPILVLNLPSSRNACRKNCESDKRIIEKQLQRTCNWVSLDSYSKYKEFYPDLPERILKSIANKNSQITVANYYGLTAQDLANLIIESYKRSDTIEYDDSEPLRRKDGTNE